MKATKYLLFTFILVLIFIMNSCTAEKYDAIPSDGQIFLYGEAHGSEKVLAKEFELWSDYYHNEGLRHLFVEYPCYTAEFLNLWMKSDDDSILNAVYDDLAGTQSHVPALKEFFQQIKAECPDTVFHGTDVGHQRKTTGERYLSYLKENSMEDSIEYELALEAISQGERFYRNNGNDFNYREDKMTENFIREFDKLDGESIMGIYGSAHTYLEAKDCMANQLKERYGENIHSEDISWLALDNEPLKTETFIVSGKEYEASYFGEQDVSSFSSDYKKREFWRLENSYDDFANNTKTGDKLPYNNYPMLIETGQVFVIDYTKKDGSVERMYYRSDGNEWNGQMTTEQFDIG